MSKPPHLYIVVLTWNGKADTLECLASLQNITYSNASILVVDNASNDGTLEAIRNRFHRVDLIRNEQNLRFAAGNNVGIRYALDRGADCILLLNNDTVVDKNFLSPLVETAESNQNIGIVGPTIYYFSFPNKIWFAGGIIKWWQGWLEHRGIREIDNGQYAQSEEVDYITGCCLLIKREVIEQIGLLDERYYMYGEDTDWCVRAHRKGFKIFYQPKSKVWHKVSVSTGGHFSWFKNWNKLKSLFRFMRYHARPIHWITIPFGLTFNVLLSSIRSKIFITK